MQGDAVLGNDPKGARSYRVSPGILIATLLLVCVALLLYDFYPFVHLGSRRSRALGICAPGTPAGAAESALKAESFTYFKSKRFLFVNVLPRYSETLIFINRAGQWMEPEKGLGIYNQIPKRFASFELDSSGTIVRFNRFE